MKIPSVTAIKQRQLFIESRKLMSVAIWRKRLLFWSCGIFVGVICVAFAYLCDTMNSLFMGIAHQSPYLPFLITPLGFMLIRIVLMNFKGAESSGIPQVMAALKISNITRRKYLVSMRIALGKFVMTFFGFMCGASLGREGPSVHLSASIMHWLGRIDHFDREDTERGLLLAGGAAGIAAAFNAPLAGVIFAIEELAGSYEKGVSGTILTTVILCGLVSLELSGNYTYFGTSSALLNMGDVNSWVMLLSVAVMGGFMGGVFSWCILFFSKLLVPVITRYPIQLAGLIGLTIAFLGYITHGDTFGSGYEAAKSLLTHADTSVVDPYYGLYKFLATLLTFLSGVPGGIFAPSLSAGAGLGALFSHLFDAKLLDSVILLSTVAYFAGVIQSPITCFIIVSEMTKNTTTVMFLPIMLTTLIAVAASKFICREPIYHVLASRYLEALRQKARLEKGNRNQPVT